MSDGIHQFADKPLRNAEDLRVACDGARKACLDLANALWFMATVLKAQLKRYEKYNAKKVALARVGERRDASKSEKAKLLALALAQVPAAAAAKAWRVRAVCVIVRHSSGLCRSAAKACDKTYRVYLKHYAGDIADQRGATFSEKEQSQRLVEYEEAAKKATGGGATRPRTPARPAAKPATADSKAAA